MIARLSVFLLFLALQFTGFAQKRGKDTLVRYFNSSLEAVPKRESSFAGVAFRDSLGWNAIIYGDSGHVIMKGKYKDDACKIKDGWFAYFFSSGKRAITGKYAANRREDNWKTWYPSGKLKDSVYFSNDLQDGPSAIFFENGLMECRGNYKYGLYEGDWEWYFDNGQVATKEKYKNGKLADIQCFDSLGTSLGMNCAVSREPEIKGRYGGIVKYLNDSLHYPIAAARQHVEGVVTVEFTVAKDGLMKNARIIYAESPLLGNEVMRVLSSVPGWYPAVYHNRTIDFTYQFNISLSPDSSLGDLRNYYQGNEHVGIPSENQ